MLNNNIHHFPNAIQVWLINLKRLNVNVLDICFENLIDLGSHVFQDNDLNELWNSIKAQLSTEKPVVIQKSEQGYLIGYLLTNSNSSSLIGLSIAPPISEITLELIRTSMGWLFYEQQSQKLQHAFQAEQLLEIFAHVINQTQFRIAAQEWINQTTTYIRNQFSHYPNIQLNYLLIKDKQKVQWIVSSELSWTEKGAADMQKLNEIALQTLFLQHELHEQHWFGYPVFNQGKIQAIIVAKDRYFEQHDSHMALSLYLKSNIDLIHPLLQHWHQSEQGLIEHGLKSGQNLFKKYSSDGHYTWKIITGFLVVFLLCITLVPVDKLVTANLNVEGKTRWIISAPTQGFIQQVLVRPGDKVKKAQPLIQLDDTDLRIQIAEQHSLLDQAQHQFRVAMAEQNLTDSGLAANQIKQQEAKIQTLQRKINQTTVTAPITGTIIDGDWIQQIGTPVEDGKELFQIASQDAYKVILHVADKDIHFIQKDQNGVLKLTGLPDQTFPIRITRITPVASVQNNVNGFKVEAAWLDSPPALTPGMQGVGKITVGKTNLLLRWSRDFINWMKLKIWSNW
ncbi:efflux RND transporter periplasmic adaptor subunit [Acinetobacter sp. VNH17]|uniref:Efflux RND transporter periplasmic adaptor subunit n=1 Tax=Acinetobacter thutiue TaxID=2998078 RepID=A0ABT7WQH1_9GAMM|nr:efflux RND transporter periplasmic adaptor subunit [Acinetobacter thutiue]MCY6412702.1 efflux RND transporter periplasmic adaptor subunit [Acinetobacter thutiue]MDN0014809.1 efflux RND transporter periplasmic adaptor subunit [Acinetobacter thutiue]